jgi:glycine cleavage system H protein
MSQGNNSRNRKEPGKSISRREFISGAGLVLGGAAISAISSGTACKSKQSAVSSPLSNKTTQSTYKAVISSTQSATSTEKYSDSVATSTYIPPLEAPPLLDVPGCTTKVASDRLYSAEHLWVKSISGGRVVLGVTDHLQAFLSTSLRLESSSTVGTVLVRGVTMGTIEATKMNIDIIAPVGGTVVQINDELKQYVNLINSDPYTRGWMMVVLLDNPDDLQELLSPESYVALIAK